MDSLNATVSASLGAFQSALRVGNSVISGVGDGGVGNDVTESEMEGTTLLMPPWGYAVSAITLFFIGFFGFLFNLIVIVLMCKDVQVRGSFLLFPSFANFIIHLCSTYPLFSTHSKPKSCGLRST